MALDASKWYVDLMRLLPLILVAACYGSRAAPPGSPAIENQQARPADSLEARVAMLEAQLAQYAEALAFLKKVYEQQQAQTEAQDAMELAGDGVFAVDIAPNVKAGMVDGPATAAVTIVKAFDFACPYCEQTSHVLRDLVKQYNGKLRVVFKNLVVHPDTAMQGHLASCAAAKQKKYLPFKEAFWTDAFAVYKASQGKDRSAMAIDNILKIATKVGLDPRKLKADMAGPDCRALIDADMAELDKFKVNATPTFFINGKHVGGGLPKKDFETLIDAQLQVVAASGVKAADYYQQEIMSKGERKFRSKKEPKP